MGKQARGKARTRNGTPQPRPRMHDWRGRETRAAREIRQECERLWLPPPDIDADLPVYARALQLDDWPRSATGLSEIDTVLEEVWK